MPILQADVKGLEVVGVAYLSQDPVLMQELLDGVDIHSDNQKKFGLPSRLISKVFKFRLIYGGTEYSYAKDPDFSPVSDNPKYWRRVIVAYYNKYYGIKEWHSSLLVQAGKTWNYVSPTGREYSYKLTARGDLPETFIKNYPVQGFGADLVAIARVSLFRRLKAKGYRSLLINTIHDSIVLDCPSDEIEAVKQLIEEVFRDLPDNFERMFKKKLNLPLTVEFK